MKNSYLIENKTYLVLMIIKLLLYFHYIQLFFAQGGAKISSMMDIQQLESQSEKADSGLVVPLFTSKTPLFTSILQSTDMYAISLMRLLLPLPFRQRQL